MSRKPVGYALRIEIAANATRVWQALTETSALQRWCAAGATISAQPGGLLRSPIDSTTQLEAQIDVFDAPRRLRLVHLPMPGEDCEQAPAVDDFLIEQRDALCIVRILGQGAAGDAAAETRAIRLQIAWRRALARLKVYLEKQMDITPPKKIIEDEIKW